jgi:Cdc6-like AAA superfamily ATPase
MASSSIVDEPGLGDRESAIKPLTARIAVVDRLLSNLHRPSSASHPPNSTTTTTSTTIPSVPPHFQAPFDALLKELETALLQGHNGSAFLLGPPACGKSLVLDLVLQHLSSLQQAAATTTAASPRRFRTVVIDGRILPGHATGRIVQEMLQQLTESALQEQDDESEEPVDEFTSENDQDDNDGDDDEEDAPTRKRPKLQHTTSSYTHTSSRQHWLRLRQRSSFLSQMDLFQQILQVAGMDGRPILIVWKHLECFVSSSTSHGSSNNNPQLLLYHLLDRISHTDCGLALVATSTHAGILSLLEKRIQSRVHGSTKCIHFQGNNMANMGDVWDKSVVQSILVEKLVHSSKNTWWMMPSDSAAAEKGTDNMEGEKRDGDGQAEDEAAMALSQELGSILLVATPSNLQSEDDTDLAKVRHMLQLSLVVGRDVRWFLRVASLALGMYREDCRRAASKCQADVSVIAVLPHTPHYWLEALRDMGATVLTEAGQLEPLQSARMRVLMDLTGPQVALLLTARRILVRDAQKNDDNHIVLTLDRIVQEYRRYSGPSNRYTEPMLRRALQDLLQLGIMRPAMDHTGSGPFQYQHTNRQWDVHTLARVPLHVTYDVRTELKLAIDYDLFLGATSTALMEWAKKVT